MVENWARAMEQSFEESRTLDRPGLANSLVRFLAHLRDPDDLTTFVYLRRHCQEGMLARAKPSQFNIFHIALKQVILNLVRSEIARTAYGNRARRGSRMPSTSGA